MAGRPGVRGQPHFVREYRNMVRFLEKRLGAGSPEVPARAVGGKFEAAGAMQAELVLSVAPAEGPFLLVDVGCGSGRAAVALRDVARCAYIGTDVVPALLDHARAITNRPDWVFEDVTGLDIPCGDGRADVVMFISVFTHLTPREVQTHLAEAARVARPGGVVICTYLDRADPVHTGVFRAPWRQRLARLLGRDVMISFTSEAELSGWLQAAGFTVERSLRDSPLWQHVLIARKTGAG